MHSILNKNKIKTRRKSEIITNYVFYNVFLVDKNKSPSSFSEYAVTSTRANVHA